MGLLVDGVWQDKWYDTAKTGGRFERSRSQLRNWVTRDGSPGPTGRGGYRAEAGRYHLYIARACPWAHRTMIVRSLKGLEGMISFSVVNWLMGERGWTFDPGPGVTEDHVNGARYLYEVYQTHDPSYSGRVTVPVLWDRETATIVNNESAEIIRMLNSAFDDVGARALDLYPEELRSRIDAINERVYATVNNGVYRAGFATSQDAYEEAVGPLFETLDWLESILTRSPFLCGEVQTEADWRLFTTLLRFDSVYHGHFKCNLRRLVDYPALWSFTRELYQAPGIRETVDFDHIKRHYYQSHRTINPTGIVPLGPLIDYEAPGDRQRIARFD
jgi:glutathionyl-hydroquinone reductase